MCPAASSRWCPTPEQLMILEEMYRGGVRTPNASQIQQITAHLSFYGKIEGKNVFYWFQNHKARDRQKLRRKLSKQLQQQQQQFHHHHHHHHQPLQPQNQHLLHYLDPPLPPPPPPPPYSSAVHQLFNYNTPPFLPQGGGGVEDQAAVINYGWKMEGPPGVGERSELEKTMMRMYSHEWMMMMEMPPPSSSPASTTPCCNNNINNNRPLKTLQLFPVAATPNVKQDST